MPFAASGLMQAAAVVVAALYFLISRGFFFATPTIGAAISLACFLVATVLVHFMGR